MIGHVALAGLPGAGKSTVGPLLAARLGMAFHDSDAELAARHGPIPALFAAQGEAGFRALEREAVRALLAGPPAVVALGGGAFADHATRGFIRRSATVVHLNASLAALLGRVGDGAGRPLLASDPAGALERLAAARGPAHALADLTVDAGRPPEAVADLAARALEDWTGPGVVPVGDPEYAVVVGPGLLASAGARLAAATGAQRALVAADATVAERYLQPLAASLAEAGVRHEAASIPPGEASKGWPELIGLVERMADLRLARSDAVVALGGGVAGDLSGFAAALYMRGVRWALVPTTLLAQVDSSVGGKTAIDLAAGKNLAGAFHPPVLVVADTALLATLPDREMRAGYAEVLKYALLGDAPFLGWLEANGPAVLARKPRALFQAVLHCVRMKARIVTADPTEQGERALLNLGHTFGHALEAETGFGSELLHGEAVALGMAMAFRFSAAEGLCGAADAARAEAAIRAAGLPTRLADLGRAHDAARLVERMRGDKKAGSGGALTLILARGVGQAFVARGVAAAAVERFLRSDGAG